MNRIVIRDGKTIFHEVELYITLDEGNDGRRMRDKQIRETSSELTNEDSSEKIRR